MTTKDRLIAARKLIESPEKWTQGEMARDADGNMTISEDKTVCRCALGACMSIQAGDGYRAMRASLNAQLPAGHIRVHEFNDAPKTTHADVLALFDRAIAGEEQ